jgi:hypothetical protein
MYKADRVMTNFIFCRKFVKRAIETGSFRWLKYAKKKTLKSHPKQFWKYVPRLRKTNADVMHLEVTGILITTPRDIAEEFSKYYNRFIIVLVPAPFINQSTKVSSLAPISNLDIHNAIKRLGPTKSVGLGGISNFVI